MFNRAGQLTTCFFGPLIAVHDTGHFEISFTLHRIIHVDTVHDTVHHVALNDATKELQLLSSVQKMKKGHTE